LNPGEKKEEEKKEEKPEVPDVVIPRKDFGFFHGFIKTRILFLNKIKKNLPAKPFTPSWHLIGLTEPTLAMQIHWLFLQK
jgi:hypothetical protein